MKKFTVQRLGAWFCALLFTAGMIPSVSAASTDTASITSASPTVTASADRDNAADTLTNTAAVTSAANYPDHISISGADIAWQVQPGEAVAFNPADFLDFFSARSAASPRYITFQPDTSLRTSNGVMYRDYLRPGQESFDRDDLRDINFYYADPSDGTCPLASLTFAASTRGEGNTVTIGFTVHGTNERYSGTLAIRIGSEESTAPDIIYDVFPGASVRFNRSDFRVFSQNQLHSTFSYVRFSAAEEISGGTLSSGGRIFSRATLEDFRFYDASETEGDYDLSTLTFRADETFQGEIYLTFRAYGESEADHAAGTVLIRVSDRSGDTSVSMTSGTILYGGNIRYATSYSDPVQLNAADFNRFFRRQYPSGNLISVLLQGVPGSGSLYYNYYGTSQYGSISRKTLTEANCTSQSFYFSPVEAAQYALSELTYIPADGRNVCVTVPFTAIGSVDAAAPVSGRTAGVQGTIRISATRSVIADVYGAIRKGQTVPFQTNAVTNAVIDATGITPEGFRILELPDSVRGTLRYGDNPAVTDVIYARSEGDLPSSALRFVPEDDYIGPLEIPYEAVNAEGTPIGAGNFNLGYVSTLANFSDIDRSVWCYKYVVELADAGVISGYSDNTFRPGNPISYGAALKLIMLAAGYPEQSPVDGGGIFSGYLAKAREDGFLTRTDVDLSSSVTRLQVAQMAFGALKLTTANLSSVQPFADTTSPAVRALNAAGIINGYFSNGVSTFRPDDNITRGQVAAIVWRMRNYPG